MADKNLIPRVFLISTALWVLGTLYFDPPTKNRNSDTNEKIEHESSSSTYESNVYGLSTKTARSSQNMIKSNSKDLSSLGNESSSRQNLLRRRLEGDDEVADTASPNWGFYVAITPEQQEMYAKSVSPWRPSNLQSS